MDFHRITAVMELAMVPDTTMDMVVMLVMVRRRMFHRWYLCKVIMDIITVTIIIIITKAKTKINQLKDRKLAMIKLSTVYCREF